jgi:AraC family transcriptional regulator, regulatory protein of adaptative response / methylated-DNA-[protein]-cysteine methyltransferase
MRAKAFVRKPPAATRANLRAMNASDRFSLAGRAPGDAEWAAITQRRHESFVFVVTSTGIVCSPGCAARIPGRERVRVVGSLAAGLAAGARPCLRCRPDRRVGSEGGIGGMTTEPVRHAVERLAAALSSGDDPPTDRELAAEVAVPERRLRDEFRAALGVTPRTWVAARRSERLRANLSKGNDVTSAVYDSGYGSASTAYEAADGGMGMTPGAYRTGGAGESITWTIAPIPDGLALVAATKRGLCSVLLGTSVDDLAYELHAEFRAAEVTRDDAAMAPLSAVVTDLANGRARPDALDLPLDVHATAFRRRVWEALRRIPAGETRSYGEIAETVGAPRAARAVGTACATNPVPIVVPCHRVLAAGGALGGYSGGLDRKRQLLGAEGVNVRGRA